MFSGEVVFHRAGRQSKLFGQRYRKFFFTMDASLNCAICMFLLNIALDIWVCVQMVIMTHYPHDLMRCCVAQINSVCYGVESGDVMATEWDGV
jgi:hypothetical protein